MAFKSPLRALPGYRAGHEAALHFPTYAYYVDATGGNDANDGLTPSTAWQTIGKVNTSTFQPGDRVLFKRGETWTGTQLTVTWSGVESRPITFGAYGSGAKPIIDGNDTVECIQAISKNYLRFENIECTQGLNSGFQFNTCHDVAVVDCDAHDCGNDNLIFITGCYDCSVSGGDFYNGYERVASTVISGIEIADDCHDITITDATCRSNTSAGLGVGITIHSHAATGMPYNITIDNCICHNNSHYGINILDQNNTAESARNIVVRNCTLHTNSQDGIRIWKSGGATTYPDGVTVDSCYVYGNTTNAFYFQGDNLTLQRNVFRGRGYLHSCTDTNFYNNTMYFETGGGLYPLYILNARTDNVTVENNITHCVVVGGMAIGVENTVVNVVTIDYNLYYLQAEADTAIRWHWKGVSKNWADWLTDSGQDANSPAADQDPLFVNPGVDFHLQAGSPAINAGVDVGLTYCGSAPDCGAYERCT